MFEDAVAELVPVKDWPWALYKVTWSRQHCAETTAKWIVSTDTHLDDEVQRRWPSDYYDTYVVEHKADTKEPPRLHSKYGVLHVDCWRHGEKVAKELNMV